MPIYMDLHHVPGITAQGVAEAHVQDLLIQDKYSCKCMTYWIDEMKESAFCLIEAPDEQAVRDLHNDAHGLMPHQIIVVDKSIVESFLGRIYDPETPDIPEGELKVFNDPGFRVLVLIKRRDAVYLCKEGGKDFCNVILTKFQQVLDQERKNYKGERAEYKGNVDHIISFRSTTDAVNFTHSILEQFTNSEKESLNIKFSINAGLPVTNSKFIFGDTIELGVQLLMLQKDEPVIIATSVRDYFLQNTLNSGFTYCTFSPNEEELIQKIFRVLEAHSDKENFSVDDFCREMALSKSSLNRTTQMLMGNTPNNLIKAYRLNKAFYLLKKNPENIAEIAFNTGFSSPSYFSKCFREYFDISPSELEEFTNI